MLTDSNTLLLLQTSLNQTLKCILTQTFLVTCQTILVHSSLSIWIFYFDILSFFKTMNIKARSQSIFVETPLVINSTGVRTIIVSVQAFKMWYGVIVKLSMTHTFIFPLLHASKVFSFHLFNEGEKKNLHLFPPIGNMSGQYFGCFFLQKSMWPLFWKHVLRYFCVCSKDFSGKNRCQMKNLLRVS